MKRAIGVCLVLVALTAIQCFAAEPAAVSKAVPKEEPSSKHAADVPQPVIPERKLTFDISEKEEPVPFGMADPELVEQRYVATFSLVGGTRLEVGLSGPVSDGYRVAVARHRSVFLGAPPRMRVETELKSALREMPQERLPSEEVLSLLTKLMTKGAPNFRRSIAPADPEARDGNYIFHFTILAPSPERAKELVQGVLAFYDYGVFYPLQKEALAAKQAYEKPLEEDRATLEKSRDEAPALAKELEELKEYTDITKEALVDFTTQLRLIGVDLVGIKARIDACNKILADRKNLSPNRIDQVETVKVTAEIELVGFAARKEAIEEIVKKGGQREELSEKYAEASSRVRSLKEEISRKLRVMALYDGELKKCMPYPVRDGKVVIRRIKWVQSATREAPPPEPGVPSRRDL